MTTVISPERTASGAGQRLTAGLRQLVDYYFVRGLEGESLQPAELRFGSALAGYRLALPAAAMLTDRVQVMIFGGAGAGKSTVTNITVGAAVADVNAQAGYTRHPTAYFRADGTGFDWPAKLGDLKRLTDAVPGNRDEDIFTLNAITADTLDPDFLRRHVVWDCPDLTSKDAEHYHRRVLEIAALADVCVYVASDERYNDELPTNFLQAMLDAGKPVIVVLTKVAEPDVEQLLTLFHDQVVARLSKREMILGVQAVPAPAAGQVRRLWTNDFLHGERLRERIKSHTHNLTELRRQGKASAITYLQRQLPRLIEPIRSDLAEWRAWAELIRRSSNDAVMQFEHEVLPRYCPTELESRSSLAAVGGPSTDPLDQFLSVVHWPFQQLRTYWRRHVPRSIDDSQMEAGLDRRRRSIVESLMIECASRRQRRPIWKQIHQSLSTEAPRIIESLYQPLLDQHRVEKRRRIESVQRTLRSQAQQQGGWSNIGRWLRLGVDVLAVGIAWWWKDVTLVGLIVAFILLWLIDEVVWRVDHWRLRRHIASVVRQTHDDVREIVRRSYIEPLMRLPGDQGGTLYTLSGLPDQLEKDLAQLARNPEA